MSHYEEKTCLRFREHTDEEDFIEFEKGLGYSEYMYSSMLYAVCPLPCI